MKNRFDFEQQMMECWNITSDLETLSNFISESKIDAATKDKLLNILIGMRDLYDMKFSQMSDTFSQLVFTKQISN